MVWYIAIIMCVIMIIPTQQGTKTYICIVKSKKIAMSKHANVCIIKSQKQKGEVKTKSICRQPSVALITVSKGKSTNSVRTGFKLPVKPMFNISVAIDDANITFRN